MIKSVGCNICGPSDQVWNGTALCFICDSGYGPLLSIVLADEFLESTTDGLFRPRIEACSTAFCEFRAVRPWCSMWISLRPGIIRAGEGVGGFLFKCCQCMDTETFWPDVCFDC